MNLYLLLFILIAAYAAESGPRLSAARNLTKVDTRNQSRSLNSNRTDTATVAVKAKEAKDDHSANNSHVITLGATASLASYQNTSPNPITSTASTTARINNSKGSNQFESPIQRVSSASTATKGSKRNTSSTGYDQTKNSTKSSTKAVTVTTTRRASATTKIRLTSNFITKGKTTTASSKSTRTVVGTSEGSTVLTSTTEDMESTEDSTTEAAVVVAGGLSTLSIVFIVLAVIIVMGIVAGLIFLYLKRKKKNGKQKSQKIEAEKTPADAKKTKRIKRKIPKVAVYKKMEAAPIKPEEFRFTGPLKLTSGAKGSMRHAMDGKSEHSLKDPVEFDTGLNEIVLIGTDVEVLEPSASVSQATDKTVADPTAADKTVTMKSEMDKKPKK